MGRNKGSASKQAHEIANALSDATFGLVMPSTVQPLLDLAKKYSRIQERWCSEDMSGTPGLQGRVEAQEKKLEENIRELAKQLPIVHSVQFTGDPRGYTVRLMLRNDKHNTWGGKEGGFGIA